MQTSLSALVYLHHIDDFLSAHWTNVNLFRTVNTGTNVSTIIEQGILVLAITDLTEIHLLVCDFPVADAFAVSLPIPVATNILIACFALGEGTLTVPLVFDPIARVRISRCILHCTTTMALPEHKITCVGGGCIGDVRSFAVIVTLLKFPRIIIAAESGINCFDPRECLGWVMARQRP